MESIALLSNSRDNGFTGVNLYCDDEACPSTSAALPMCLHIEVLRDKQQCSGMSTGPLVTGNCVILHLILQWSLQASFVDALPNPRASEIAFCCGKQMQVCHSMVSGQLHCDHSSDIPSRRSVFLASLALSHVTSAEAHTEIAPSVVV